MKMAAYAWLHLIRNWKNTLAVVLTYMTVLMVILSVQQSVKSRQAALESMAEGLILQGNVADETGRNSQYLQLDKFFPEQFLGDTSIAQMVKDVNVRAEYPGTYLGIPFRLIAITREEADTYLRFNGSVIYDENVRADIWMSDEMVCAVSDDLAFMVYQAEDGHSYIDITGQFPRGRYDDTVDVPLTFRVIGTAPAPESVYVPYKALLHACDQVGHITFTADSLSFTIRSNAELDRFRSFCQAFFGDCDPLKAGERTYTMVIKDRQYLELTHEAAKNLAVIQLLQPVLYLCALGAGIMLVVMQMRSRKREMAVIRSLGAGRVRVMMQIVLEYAIICLPVTLFALLIWRELSPMTVFGVWLAFMVGAMCTIVRFSVIPLVKQIRELEE